MGSALRDVMYNSLRRRRATLAAQLIDLEARLSERGSSDCASNRRGIVGRRVHSEFGITGELRHASYVEGWITMLKDDPRALMRAASRASKATAYLYPETSAEEADNTDDIETEPLREAAE